MWWAVRAKLRPIDDMIDAAGHIGSGDLSHRIPTAEPNTEVGQLAVALNSMLNQIETAVAAKTESESRMRPFLSDASHELRTPLTSIRGYAEFHHHGATSPEQINRALDRIEQEATRMTGLVDDLLLLARIDQRRPLASETVDVAKPSADAVGDAKAVEPDRPITFHSSNGKWFVAGDEDRLRQAIDNLLANVRQHTPPGTPVAVIVAGDTQMITIEVADAGPGMAPQAAEKAFERFYQADPNHSGSGSGLGLSIVQAIAEAHKATATLTTRPENGTTVTIQLPASDGP